jgi:hypothetical protein
MELSDFTQMAKAKITALVHEYIGENNIKVSDVSLTPELIQVPYDENHDSFKHFRLTNKVLKFFWATAPPTIKGHIVKRLDFWQANGALAGDNHEAIVDFLAKCVPRDQVNTSFRLRTRGPGYTLAYNALEVADQHCTLRPDELCLVGVLFDEMELRQKHSDNSLSEYNVTIYPTLTVYCPIKRSAVVGGTPQLSAPDIFQRIATEIKNGLAGIIADDKIKSQCYHTVDNIVLQNSVAHKVC